MHTLFGKARDLSPAMASALAAYERKTWVERPGSTFPAPCDDGSRFDSADTIYVIAREGCGAICGSARLSPTFGPCLLNEVFPHLLAGMPAPQRREVWELSRFTVETVDPNPAASAAARARSMLGAAMTSAFEHGARRLITVSPLATERLLHRLGVHAHRAGSPVPFNGQPLFACWIEMDEQTIGALGLSSIERRVQGHARRIEPSLHLPGFHGVEEERS
jgi:acyl homoserine lactone synthase